MTLFSNNCQSVLSSTRFDFESSDSISGTSVLFCILFKMLVTFFLHALLNLNDTLDQFDSCQMYYSSDVVLFFFITFFHLVKYS